VKLNALQEARYAGEEQQLKKLMQYFYAEDELSDENETIYFPHETLLVRNHSVGVANDEVMWIKILKDDPSKIGVMYVDEDHDWIPTKDVVEGFYVYETKMLYGKGGPGR
jgi:hypothetical protein